MAAESYRESTTVETVTRRAFEQRTADDSAETLAEHILDGLVGALAHSRSTLEALVASEIRQGPSAYSSLGSDYHDGAILDVSAEDVIACFEKFFCRPEVQQWPDSITEDPLD